LTADTKGVLPTDGRFKQAWPHHARFVEDVISYLFRLSPQRARLQLIEQMLDRLPKDLTFHELIEQLAEIELAGAMEDRNTALQIVVQGAMPNHDRVRAYVTATYDEVLPRWAAIYEKVATLYGLSLRPGCTWLDMAIMFDALLEGLALRVRCQAEAPTLASGRPALPGTILALLHGLLAEYDGEDRYQVGPDATVRAIHLPEQRLDDEKVETIA
jgi:hypothetical protein